MALGEGRLRVNRIIGSVRIPILITSYGELCNDLEGLCRRICDFCGIRQEQFCLVDFPKTIDNHFRLADDSEWRRGYSSAQVERANAKLPPELAYRFHWYLSALITYRTPASGRTKGGAYLARSGR